MSFQTARRATGNDFFCLPVFFQIGRGLLLLLLAFLVDDGRPAFAFELNAQLQHSLGGGEEIETTSTLKQIYRVSDGIQRDVTDAILAGASISYTRTEQTNQGTFEVLSPGALFNVHNDIFNFGLSGVATQNRRENAANFDTSAWRATLSPASYPWDRKYWPGLAVYYGESKATREDPGGFDSKEIDYGGNAAYKLFGLADLFYGYDDRRNENTRSQRVVETATHTGRLVTAGQFWDNRVFIKFTQGFKHESVTDSGVVPPSGDVEQIPQVSFTFYSLLAPTDPPFDEQNFPLGDNQNSDLGNLENTNTVPLGPDQRWHLGVSPVFAPDGEQQVDLLRVYVDDPFGELVTDQSQLRWALYGSFDNTTWELVDQNVVAVYNSADQRFEVKIKALDRDFQFLMMVVTNLTLPGTGAVTVNIRAVETIPLREGQPGSSFSESAESTSYNTNANMRMSISPTLKAASNLDTNYGADFFRGAFHGNLNWSPSRLVSPSLAFSETLQDSSGREKSINRLYSIGVPISLLPTLNFNFNASRAERFTGSRMDSFLNVYNFGASALLYPDLSASLTERYSTGEDQEPDGSIRKRENFGGDLTLKATLTPKLRAEITNTFNKQYQPRQDRTFLSDFKFYIRPSDFLSLDLQYTKSWLGIAFDSQLYSLHAALLRTRKTRVNFLSQYRKQTSQNPNTFLSLQGSWDISKMLTLRCQGSYNISETDTWSVLTTVFFRL